jgi:hypothetical protein
MRTRSEATSENSPATKNAFALINTRQASGPSAVSIGRCPS